MAPNILAMGIYPPFTDEAAQCSDEDKRDPVKKKCFARFSVSVGDQAISLPTGTLTIPAGVALAGGIKLPMGNESWTASIDALIGLDKKNPTFYVDGEMDPFKLGDWLHFGGSLTADGTAIDYDKPEKARFYMDFRKTPFTIAVDIQGAVCIPKLASCGMVQVWLGKDRFDFCTYATVFGLAKAAFSIGWTWNFSRFHVKGYFETDPNAVGGIGSTVAEGLVSMFETFLDGMKGIITDIQDAIPVVTLPYLGLASFSSLPSPSGREHYQSKSKRDRGQSAQLLRRCCAWEQRCQ